MVLLFTTTSILFVENAGARENGSDLDIVGEPEYELINKITRDGNVIGWSYKINVKIKNNGDRQSEETVVRLTDEDDVSLSKTLKIDAGETENILFNWSAISNKDQNIEISFFPSNKDKAHTNYNSGSTTFTIIIGDSDGVAGTSTPGFELILTVLAVIIVIFYSNKKKRK